MEAWNFLHTLDLQSGKEWQLRVIKKIEHLCFNPVDIEKCNNCNHTRLMSVNWLALSIE